MRIAVPNKGRLHEPTIDLLERAGLHLENGADRKLYADTVDPDVTVLFARAADIPEYVSDGAADLGITGFDQVQEARVDNVSELLDLEFGRCRLVLAAPEDGDIERLEDLAGKTVATEFPNITEDFFADTGVEPDIVEVSGATELTPHVEMADAIVDITSTGTTLKMNRLAIVDEVLSSSVRLFGRDDVLDEPKIDEVRTALSSVKQAEGKRYLMMNVPRDRLEDVRDVIRGWAGRRSWTSPTKTTMRRPLLSTPSSTSEMSSRRSPRSKRRRERYFGDRDRATGRVVRSVVTRVAGYAGTRAPDRPESGLLESGGDRSLERVELEKGVERGAVRRRADKAPHPIEAHDIVFLEQREMGFTERRVDPLAQLVDRRPDRRVAFGIGEPADERSEGIGSSVASTQRRISHRRSLSTTREIVSRGGTTTERTVVAEAKPIRSGRRWIRVDRHWHEKVRDGTLDKRDRSFRRV